MRENVSVTLTSSSTIRTRAAPALPWGEDTSPLWAGERGSSSGRRRSFPLTSGSVEQNHVIFSAARRALFRLRLLYVLVSEVVLSPILVRPVREQLEHDRVIRLLQAKYK